MYTWTQWFFPKVWKSGILPLRMQFLFDGEKSKPQPHFKYFRYILDPNAVHDNFFASRNITKLSYLSFKLCYSWDLVDFDIDLRYVGFALKCIGVMTFTSSG